MLVLTRKSEEDIVITVGSHKIVIKILEVRGGKVSIGIEAPKVCSIVRAELLNNNNSNSEMSNPSSSELTDLELVGAPSA